MTPMCYSHKSKQSSIWLSLICDSAFPVVFLYRRAYTLIFSADCIQVTCPNWPLFLRTPVVHWCAARARPYGHAHIKRLHDALLTKTAMKDVCQVYETTLTRNPVCWKVLKVKIQVKRFERVHGSSSQSFPWCRSSGDDLEDYIFIDFNVLCMIC